MKDFSFLNKTVLGSALSVEPEVLTRLMSDKDASSIRQIRYMTHFMSNAILNSRSPLFTIQLAPYFETQLQDAKNKFLVTELLKLGAPNDFMYKKFGLNSRECRDMRIANDIKASATRRVMFQGDHGAKDRQAQEIQRLLSHFCMTAKNLIDADPDVWIGVYEFFEGRYLLKQIWQAVNRYDMEGMEWIPQQKKDETNAKAS